MKNKNTITLHKGGTAEETIEVSKIIIPDLWHIAQNHPSTIARDAILKTWHLAHELLKVVKDRITWSEATSDLLEACEICEGRLSEMHSEMDFGPELESVRSAIAKAKAQGIE